MTHVELLDSIAQAYADLGEAQRDLAEARRAAADAERRGMAAERRLSSLIGSWTAPVATPEPVAAEA